MKKKLILALIAVLAIVGIIFAIISFRSAGKTDKDKLSENQVKVYNPAGTVGNTATAYCRDHDGDIALTKEDENGQQKTVCIFEDGSECDAWQFAEGKCKKGDFKPEPVTY